MRYFVIAFALGTLACFGGARRAPYPQYRIPATPEGSECARQCMTVHQTCLAAEKDYFNRDQYCDQKREECRATCPGAERTN